MKQRFTKAFFLQDTFIIAKTLIGSSLMTYQDGHLTGGKIVEVEVYLGGIDKAAHAYGYKRTKRTEIQYGVGGYAYISLVYGMYWQFNVVTAPVNVPDAILIRAIEPTVGLDIMRQRRGSVLDKNLTNGPGKLCMALGITKHWYGADLRGQQIWLAPTSSQSNCHQIIAAKRIGIDYAEEFASKPWRYYLAGNAYVSKK